MRADLTTPWVSAAFAVEPGEVLAVVGPNGAGKSTLLRALAGLQPATGSLEIGGVDVLHAPPHQRRVGWVPQDRLLFEHLSALGNVSYGIRRRAAAQAWLDRLGVGQLADRRPAQLSGGEAARVALARALAPEPDLLLLDEPLAALDAATRDDVRRLLRQVLSGGWAAVLVVTHDPVDVVSLADRLLVLEDGRVVQDSTPQEVVRAPRTAWTAALLGQNAWRGTTDERGLRVDGGGHVLVAEPLPAGLPALALAEPSAVTLHRRAPEGSARNVLTGAVTEVRALGGRVRVVVRSTPAVVAEVTVASAADLRLADGGLVHAAVKATEVRLVRV
ncbi:MAG: transporter ATPase [Frankiales bacterium]|jgi:molybdopterin-binding protein|nr:transporter ATPase [Frankiales bacterium]